MACGLLEMQPGACTIQLFISIIDEQIVRSNFVRSDFFLNKGETNFIVQDPGRENIKEQK